MHAKARQDGLGINTVVVKAGKLCMSDCYSSGAAVLNNRYLNTYADVSFAAQMQSSPSQIGSYPVATSFLGVGGPPQVLPGSFGAPKHCQHQCPAAVSRPHSQAAHSTPAQPVSC